MSGWLKMGMVLPCVLIVAFVLWVTPMVLWISTNTSQMAWAASFPIVFVGCVVATYRIVANEIRRYIAFGEHSLVYGRFWSGVHVPYDEVRLVEHDRRVKVSRVFFVTASGRRIGLYLSEPDAAECFQSLRRFCDGAASMDSLGTIEPARSPEARAAAAALVVRTYTGRAWRYGLLAAFIAGVWGTLFVIYLVLQPSSKASFPLHTMIAFLGFASLMAVAAFTNWRAARESRRNPQLRRAKFVNLS